MKVFGPKTQRSLRMKQDYVIHSQKQMELMQKKESYSSARQQTRRTYVSYGRNIKQYESM